MTSIRFGKVSPEAIEEFMQQVRRILRPAFPKNEADETTDEDGLWMKDVAERLRFDDSMLDGEEGDFDPER